MKKIIFLNILKVTGAILLFLAIGKHSYDYYILLRWIVFSISIYCIYMHTKREEDEWIFLFLLIGLLFNPIIPLHLTRRTWKYIDIISGSLLLFSIYTKFRKQGR